MTALVSSAQSVLLSLPYPALQDYTQYIYNITADSSTTILTFLFRQDPTYWGFDNISLKDSFGNELMVNGGFETGDTTGWLQVRQQGLAMDGVVVPSTVGTTADDSEEENYYWVDGEVEGVDGLAQAIATVTGQTYTLSFWLAGSGGSSSGSQFASFDAWSGAPVSTFGGKVMLYNSQPTADLIAGIAPLPEPSTLAQTSLGGLAMLWQFRRRNKSPATIL